MDLIWALAFPRAVRHRKRKESLDFVKLRVFSPHSSHSSLLVAWNSNSWYALWKFSPTLAIPVQALQSSISPVLYSQDWSASASGYKKSKYTRKSRPWLHLVYGSTGHLTIPASTYPKSFPWERCPNSYLCGSCCWRYVFGISFAGNPWSSNRLRKRDYSLSLV